MACRMDVGVGIDGDCIENGVGVGFPLPPKICDPNAPPAAPIIGPIILPAPPAAAVAAVPPAIDVPKAVPPAVPIAPPIAANKAIVTYFPKIPLGEVDRLTESDRPLVVETLVPPAAAPVNCISAWNGDSSVEIAWFNTSSGSPNPRAMAD